MAGIIVRVDRVAVRVQADAAGAAAQELEGVDDDEGPRTVGGVVVDGGNGVGGVVGRGGLRGGVGLASVRGWA